MIPYRFLFAVAAFLGFAHGPALGQVDPFFHRTIPAYNDLRFSGEVKSWSMFASVANSTFKPEGEGPFPAIVLVHTCGGLQPHIGARAKELLAEGFAVLVLDSYGPRNHTIFCTAQGVSAARVYKDAFDALKHLKTLKEVDPNRIYLVGFSLGSFAAASVASPTVASLTSSTERFNASVGWYGSCTFDVSPYPKWHLVRSDIDRPLLLLMAKNDKETPIDECFPLLDSLKSAGRQVDWHIYDDATHGWDKNDSRLGYRYNKDVTEDAMRRTVTFLKQH